MKSSTEIITRTVTAFAIDWTTAGATAYAVHVHGGRWYEVVAAWMLAVSVMSTATRTSLRD